MICSFGFSGRCQKERGGGRKRVAIFSYLLVILRVAEGREKGVRVAEHSIKTPFLLGMPKEKKGPDAFLLIRSPARKERKKKGRSIVPPSSPPSSDRTRRGEGRMLSFTSTSPSPSFLYLHYYPECKERGKGEEKQ